MDKLNPTFQDTPLTTKTPESVSSWFTTETHVGVYSSSEAAWMIAQGWRPYATVTSNGRTSYFMSRRVIQTENVLSALVTSYTTAYNEGRQLNDQRYDDLLVLYLAILDKTEDELNALETDDDAHSDVVLALVGQIATDFSDYDTDVTGDLDDWGDSIIAEINARFDAELSKAQQALIDRGLYSSTHWTVISAGIERERTRALLAAQDQIKQQQLGLKHKVYDELVNMRARVLAARDRLRVYLREAKDRALGMRNAAAEALGRLVEARTDSYPDLAQVGQLAAALGSGSPQAGGV